MKFEKHLTLKPIKSAYKDTTYYEQILIFDGGYAAALVHQDLFWPGGRKDLPADQFYIHDKLNEGETLEVKVTFEVIEDE